MLAMVPIGQGLVYRLPVNQRKEVISFSQRTMRYFMLFVLNLLARAKVSTIYLELTLIYIQI